MILRIFLFYLIGFLQIEVEGFYIERLMNKCKSLGIFIWNIKRKKSTNILCSIGIKEFKKLRKIAKQTKCKNKIKKKRGLPFLLNKYKKRKIFLCLLIIIVISIFILSKFIWNIEIIGAENIDEEELLETLKASGLELGKFKKNIDINKIIEKVRLERDDIAWIGIDIQGTNAIIEIVESTPKPEIIDKSEYCNIVSDKTGMITQIDVTNGTAAVKVGDAVEPGTVLVNRIYGRKIYRNKIRSCYRNNKGENLVYQDNGS